MKSAFPPSTKAAGSEYTLSWYSQHRPALSGPCPIQTASQELLLSQPALAKVRMGELTELCLSANPPTPFPTTAWPRAHTTRGVVAPRCALAGQRDQRGHRSRAQPTLWPSPRSRWEGRWEGSPALPAGDPGLPCPPKLCTNVWPQFLELLWRRSRESRKDLKAAGRSEPPQPRWAVQPAGQSLALNADQPLG